jgi:hypothetical protein
MRRVRLPVWLGGALGVAFALWLLTDRPPRMPGDGDHDVTLAEAHCLTCHAHAARHPRPADHPLRDDCFSCHRDAAGALHPREGAPTGIPGGWGDDPRLRPAPVGP